MIWFNIYTFAPLFTAFLCFLCSSFSLYRIIKIDGKKGILNVSYSKKEVVWRLILVIFLSVFYLFNQFHWIDDNDGKRIGFFKDFCWSLFETITFIIFTISVIQFLFRLSFKSFKNNLVKKEKKESLLKEILIDEKKFTKLLFFLSFLVIVLLSALNKLEPLQNIIITIIQRSI